MQSLVAVLYRYTDAWYPMNAHSLPTVRSVSPRNRSSCHYDDRVSQIHCSMHTLTHRLKHKRKHYPHSINGISASQSLCSV